MIYFDLVMNWKSLYKLHSGNPGACYAHVRGPIRHKPDMFLYDVPIDNVVGVYILNNDRIW